MTEMINPLRHLPQARTGDDGVWDGRHIVWKVPSSWAGTLSAWLAPRFRRDGMRRLKPGTYRDLCWDDHEWSRVLAQCLVADLDYHAGKLAEAIARITLRVYHGCRTDDAGVYSRAGLNIHDRAEMKCKLGAILDAHPELNYLKARLPEAMAAMDIGIDEECLFVVADDQSLIEHAAHYLIYGSEWISSVLGQSRYVLKKVGTPTLLEIDLPLRIAHPATRREFASTMLREWTRLACNTPDWSAPIDFTFTLRENIPPAWIVGHSHPTELADPLEQFSKYTPTRLDCAHCRE
ncbi:hypothetical protein [Bradyrhizobium sp. SZCCHNR2026]|uniref:hypothetical protein n=1 Tax=Bradyrhizobium sp. SZCCHNR2026 TaxID=3057381 RepID=UPI002915ED56|nr:hypothetical protein [Bradyrhizobium sp. SZCCHNR2026]